MKNKKQVFGGREREEQNIPSKINDSEQFRMIVNHA